MKIVGIVMRCEKIDNTYKWFLNESYLNAIEELNVAVFPICSYASLQKAQRICCGLIVPGGHDIHGYYLKENQIKQTKTYDKTMDHFDFACIASFDQKKKPILGICRGMQMLNVYFKGTLFQHIKVRTHAYQHMHEIQSCEDSFLRSLYPISFNVNSYHHQCIDVVGNHIKVAAISHDAHIEAIEHENKRIIGVQWHPEKMEDNQVFAYFLDVLCN